MGNRVRFWLLALAWLPLLYCGFWVFGFLHFVLVFGMPMEIVVERYVPHWPRIPKYLVASLAVLGPIGLPPALLCRQVWRSGHRRTARVAWIAMAAITAVLLFRYGIPTNADHGLVIVVIHLLPVWIVVYLAIFSAPLWIAVLLLERRGNPVTGHDSGLSVLGWRNRLDDQ